jgi:hypothetical protein
MIPVMLQNFLITELKCLFDGYYLKNVLGQESPINIYGQYLPKKKSDKDTEQFPHIRVILLDGEENSELDPNLCRVLIMTGVWDHNQNYQGFQDVCNVLQRTYDHLMRTQLFDNRYKIEYPIKWSLTEEDYWPYFYGGLETNWSVGKITPADFD